MASPGPDDILFLTPVMPAASGNGLAMRAGVFLEGLARSHSVSVLVAPVFGGAGDPDWLVRRHAARWRVLDVASAGDARAEVTALLAGEAGRRRAGAVHPLPALARRAAPSHARAIGEAAQGAVLVHTLRLYLATLLDGVLDRRPAVPVTIDVDEPDWLVSERGGDAEEAERHRRLARHYLPRAAAVTTASRADAVALAAGYGLTRVTPVPNAVRPPARGLSAPASCELLFVGNLSYEPNVQAAQWLCDEVAPLLGPVSIALVGSRPAPAVRRLGERPGVSVAADVPEVGSWYAGCRVAVAPLHAGGGTRTKVVEALAHGRPVVATPVGAEGLDLGSGDGLLVAEGPADFAAACRRLLGDPELAELLGRRGRRSALASAGADRVAATIDRLARSILAR